MAEEKRAPRAKRVRVQWTEDSKERFLDELAASCNIKASAAAIGVCARSAYNLRARDPDFAAGWAEALATAYEIVETRLLAAALDARELAGGGESGDGAEAEREPPLNVALAVRLLNDRRRTLQGRPRRGGREPRRATEAETDAAILKKLTALERAAGVSE